MQLFVKTLTGAEICIDVDNYDTIERVKYEICEREDVDPCQQRIIHHGRQLQDGQSLADCNVANGSTLQLLLRLRGGMMGAAGGKGASNNTANSVVDELLNAPDYDIYKDLTFKQKIFLTFDEPTYSKLALFVMILLNATILFATVTFILQTCPSIDESLHPDTWFWMETVAILIFTIDFVARLVTNDNMKEFWTDPFNQIDVVAILPYYVELLISALGGSTAGSSALGLIRVLRLARVLRIMKFTKQGAVAPLIMNIIKLSGPPLIIPLYFLVLALVMYASLIYFIEAPTVVNCNDKCHEVSDDTCTPPDDIADYDECCYCYGDVMLSSNQFPSIPYGMWWCMTTMTTVGYGDMSPVTGLGQTVAVAALATGVFFLAMPLSCIGGTFCVAWGKMLKGKANLEATNMNSMPGDFKFMISFYDVFDSFLALKEDFDSKFKRSDEAQGEIMADLDAKIDELLKKHEVARTVLRSSFIGEDRDEESKVVTMDNNAGSAFVEELLNKEEESEEEEEGLA